MKDITIINIEYGSNFYNEFIGLRDKILRAPLGLKLEKEELLNDHKSYHFVALKNDEVIGGGILEPLSPQKAQVRQMVVASSYQYKGVGQNLLTYMEKFAKELRIQAIEMDARESAKGFYIKLGYKALGEPFIKKTIPHVKMQKTL